MLASYSWERCVAEVTVLERTREQAGRLKALRLRLGLKKADITSRLGWESTQTYDLYERATSVIRLDRVPDWADAFGIKPDQFASVILGTRELDDVFPAPVADDWTMAKALHGHVPDGDIPGFVAEHAGKSLQDQKQITESIIRSTHRAQRKATRPRKPPTTRRNRTA
jgi:transcriptional regulator with XRE-family HTH domain